jgi:hypothetical protein
MAILEKTLVTATENMTDKTFVRHMEARHSGSLSYIVGLGTILGDKMLVRMWRLYHGHLHQWRIDLEHEHGEP